MRTERCARRSRRSDQKETQIETSEFHALNRCLDVAIAGAVTSYEQASHPSGAHQEMRTVLAGAQAAFHALRGGAVGVGGAPETSSREASPGWRRSSRSRLPCAEPR